MKMLAMGAPIRIKEHKGEVMEGDSLSEIASREDIACGKIVRAWQIPVLLSNFVQVSRPPSNVLITLDSVPLVHTRRLSPVPSWIQWVQTDSISHAESTR
jgi:hypothetical protein